MIRLQNRKIFLSFIEMKSNYTDTSHHIQLQISLKNQDILPKRFAFVDVPFDSKHTCNRN
jgi:hypothetical protein